MQRETYEKMQKYLPSRKFLAVIGITLGVILGAFALTSLFGSSRSFDRLSKTAPVTANGTIAELIVQDTNGNGLSDWEESLWGLDPKGDGPANKRIVDGKKSAANIKPDTSGAELTGTDKFSQSLLSTLLALNQSGNLTPEAVENLAATIGESIDAKHANLNTYSKTDMRITATDDEKAKQAYMIALKKVIDRYENVDLGSELVIISQSLEGGGAPVLAKLKPLADAYTSLGREIISVTTPNTAVPFALALANSTAVMGVTLDQMMDFYEDVTVGMVSLDDYVKASTASDQAVASLQAYFSN